ncbi:UNVERIFIED_CONTAM: hypothetical protein HDU68_004114 [Siphonaria sp. JEL0065]|nr:hypothetical protein HDU68_004114 [Siphonaria sp. JEL0065]
MLALTFFATAASAISFSSCSSWGDQCNASIRPNTCIGLAPLCYAPSATVVCAACKCLDGSLKGTLQGGSVQMGVADSVCQQFFSTNSTAGLGSGTGPVLVSTTQATTAPGATTTGAASNGFAASAAAALVGGILALVL